MVRDRFIIDFPNHQFVLAPAQNMIWIQYMDTVHFLDQTLVLATYFQKLVLNIN